MSFIDRTRCFFGDSFGYIGNAVNMPQRTTRDKIGAIVGLTFLSLATGGIFFFIEVGRYYWKGLDPDSGISFKARWNLIFTRIVSWKGEYTTWSYNYIRKDIHSIDDFLSRCNILHHNAIACLNFSEPFKYKFGNKVPIIVPRLNFFTNPIKTEEDLAWIKLAIIYFGGTGNRPPGTFNEIHQKQFEEYAKLVLESKDSDSIIKDIANILKKAQAAYKGDSPIAEDYLTSLRWNYKGMICQKPSTNLFMTKIENELSK